MSDQEPVEVEETNDNEAPVESVDGDDSDGGDLNLEGTIFSLNAKLIISHRIRRGSTTFQSPTKTVR